MLTRKSNEFRVFFNTPGSNQYTLLDDDDNDGVVNNGVEATTIKNIQDEYHDVTFSNPSGNSPIFHPRGTASDLTTLTLSNSSGSKSITISIAGRVKIN